MHLVVKGGNPLWIRRIKLALKYRLENNGRGYKLAINYLLWFSLGRGTVSLNCDLIAVLRSFVSGVRDFPLSIHCG